MRVLLVRPSTKGYAVPPPEVPSGLLYLAAALREAGHEPQVCDLERQELPDPIAFDAIGVTLLSKCRQSGYRVIKEIKSRAPGVMIVAGGPHASSVPELLLENLPIDCVIVGEGERALMEALRTNARGMLRAVPAEDTDSLPFPAYDLAALGSYDMQLAAAFPDWNIDGLRLGDLRHCAVIGSRGCIGRCAFCNAYKHWGLRLRRRSGGLIVDELEMLERDHGVRLVAFNDNMFPASKRQGMEFCEEKIRRRVRTLWKCDCRPDVIDEELALAMRRAGCFLVAVGLESGSPKILRSINKMLDLEKAHRSMTAIKNANLLLHTLLMVGNPGESADTIEETVKYVNDVRPHFVSWVRGVMVLPDTELCKLAGIPDEFWIEGDDLPYYTVERTMEEISEFALRLETIKKDGVPAALVKGSK